MYDLEFTGELSTGLRQGGGAGIPPSGSFVFCPMGFAPGPVHELYRLAYEQALATQRAWYFQRICAISLN
jgi:hypothetical protein